MATDLYGHSNNNNLQSGSIILYIIYVEITIDKFNKYNGMITANIYNKILCLQSHDLLSGQLSVFTRGKGFIKLNSAYLRTFKVNHTAVYCS